MLGRETILQTLHEHLSRFQLLGVERLGLFGSFARDEARPDSDIDILIRFLPGRKSFDRYMEIKFLLEELFPAHKIDLVMEDNLREEFSPYIFEELKYAS